MVNGESEQPSAPRLKMNRLLLYFYDDQTEAEFAERSLTASLPFVRAYLSAGVGL